MFQCLLQTFFFLETPNCLFLFIFLVHLLKSIIEIYRRCAPRSILLLVKWPVVGTEITDGGGGRQTKNKKEKNKSCKNVYARRNRFMQFSQRGIRALPVS